jgi:hypothetical protein
MAATDFSRVPVTLVDLALPRCSRTYGTAPCTAAIGSTGDDRCYNTFATCQDAANFSAGSSTFRMTRVDAPALPGIAAFPCITGITTIPTVLDQRNGLGARELLRLEVDDFIDDDFEQDPYVTQRTIRTPRRFWVRLAKRHRAWRAVTLTIREGYLEADGTLIVSGMSTRGYVLENVELGAGGRVTITAKDVLKILDGVKIPATSDGALAAGIGSGDASCSVGSGEGAQYGTAPFYVRIDSEIILVNTRSTDSFSSITRAQFGTTAAAHSAAAAVQLCRVWTGTDAVDDIWEDILLDAGVTAGQISKTDYTTDVDKYLATLTPSVCISEPTPASELLAGLMVQTMSMTWWDAEAQKVKAAVIKPRQPLETLTEIGDEYNILGDSVSVVPMEAERVTRGAVAHGVKVWTDGLDDAKNYAAQVRYIDTDAESANEYGDVKDRTLYAYWIGSSLTAVADSLCYRLVSKFRNAPKRITLDLDPKDGDALAVGDLVELTTYLLVDDTGAATATECFVVAKRRKQGSLSRWTFTLETSGTAGRWGFWAPDTATAYPNDPDYGHWADGTTEKMPGGDPPYLWG